jgi:hypothetical protein
MESIAVRRGVTTAVLKAEQAKPVDFCVLGNAEMGQGHRAGNNARADDHGPDWDEPNVHRLP